MTVRAAGPAERAIIDTWRPYEVLVPAGRDRALAVAHLRRWLAEARKGGVPTGLRRLDLVAVENDALLGFLTLLLGGRDALTGEPAAYVADVQVKPAVRRRGVARALIEAALAVCRREGTALVTLDVAEGNAAARGLYASLGFRPEALRLGLRLDGRGGAGGPVVVDGDGSAARS